MTRARRGLIIGGVVLVVLGGYGALDAADVVPGVLTVEPVVPEPAPFPDPDVPDAAAAGVGPLDPHAPAPSATALGEITAALVDDERSGDGVGIAVLDGLTGELLVDVDAEDPRTPASSLKLLPAVTALDALGPDHVLRTRAVSDGDDVVLVAGGDIRLVDDASDDDDAHARGSLADLAAQVAESLTEQGRTRTSVTLDDTLFTGPRYAPDWGGIDFDFVMPIQPLAVDSGESPEGGYEDDPALAAAETFAEALGSEGIDVTGKVTRADAPADPEELGTVTSEPLAALVAHTLAVSDNSTAEVLGRLVALADGEQPSFDGAARAVEARLISLGLGTDALELADTSGLLVENQVSPLLLAEVLQLAHERSDLHALLDALPIAAFEGTLGSRLEGAAAGVARAKTGTLITAASLSGTVLDADGRLLVFSVIADDLEPGGVGPARAAVDEWVTALAGCGCR